MLFTAPYSPFEETGNPASITSTPNLSRAFAIVSFCSLVSETLGVCSPSRSVVSKKVTTSLFILELTKKTNPQVLTYLHAHNCGATYKTFSSALMAARTCHVASRVLIHEDRARKSFRAKPRVFGSNLSTARFRQKSHRWSPPKLRLKRLRQKRLHPQSKQTRNL